MKLALPPNDRRLNEIDSLRAIAAMAVLVMHWTFYFDKTYAAPGVVPFRFPYGGFGVNLFFVISGFVITMTLERCRSVKDFARSRFFRLYPTFWVCMLLSASVTHVLGPAERAVGAADIAANLTMVPGWFGRRLVDGVYWTLAVELGFYAWMAVFFATGLLATPAKRARVALVWVGLSAGAGILRLLPLGRGSGFALASSAMLLDWIGLFGAGIVLFDAHRAKGTLRPEAWAVVVLGAVSQLLWQSKTSALVMLASAGAVWVASNLRPWWMRLRPIVWIGLVSYPLYLLHQNLGYAGLSRAQDYGIPFICAYPILLCIVLGISGAAHYIIEKPASTLFRKPRSNERVQQNS